MVEGGQAGVLSYRGNDHKVPKSITPDEPEIQVYCMRVCCVSTLVCVCVSVMCRCTVSV